MTKLKLIVFVLCAAIVCQVCAQGSIHNDNAAASNEPTSMAIGAIVATAVLCGIGAILCIGGLVFSCKKCVTDGIIV
ncbi:Hypothetical predicted protein [Mytilus galloprovincialis]|uniref:Uncharacterized protein n=1 Tax=Mytilus galloprovincialis TaxID=29158 RepID=A0A8B6GLL1_MYTGA|nr:Hypothetical predicted protein [Mytilus galloprovincialis]